LSTIFYGQVLYLLREYTNKLLFKTHQPLRDIIMIRVCIVFVWGAGQQRFIVPSNVWPVADCTRRRGESGYLVSEQLETTEKKIETAEPTHNN